MSEGLVARARRPGAYLRELGTAAALALLLLTLSGAAPGFFAPDNLRDLAVANAPVLIIAVGMTLVLLTGRVDISVGSHFAVCSIAAALLARAGLPMPLVLAAVMLLGALLGALNGWFVARLALPSVVVTLATMVIWRDGLRWATEGAWVQGLPISFQWFGLSQRAGESGIILVATLALLAGMSGSDPSLPDAPSTRSARMRRPRASSACGRISSCWACSPCSGRAPPWLPC